MRKLIHNFGKYNLIVEQYLDILMNKSDEFYHTLVLSGKIDNNLNEKNIMHKCIDGVEDFLYYYYDQEKAIFNHILTVIINNVKVVAPLSKKERGLYGKAESENKTIYLNPGLKESKTLTSLERTKLYVAHELGHIINDGWMNKCEKSLNIFFENGIIDSETAQKIYDGFSMLNESITQNRAEEIIYFMSKKIRPKSEYRHQNNLFNGESYLTNYDYYGELQEPAIMFARTLRGIGKIDDDEEALNVLSKRALSSDFYDAILNEYNRDHQTKNFLRLTMLMGDLKRASYANFGMEDIYSILSKIKTSINKI